MKIRLKEKILIKQLKLILQIKESLMLLINCLIFYLRNKILIIFL